MGKFRNHDIWSRKIWNWTTSQVFWRVSWSIVSAEYDLYWLPYGSKTYNNVESVECAWRNEYSTKNMLPDPSALWDMKRKTENRVKLRRTCSVWKLQYRKLVFIYLKALISGILFWHFEKKNKFQEPLNFSPLMNKENYSKKLKTNKLLKTSLFGTISIM